MAIWTGTFEDKRKLYCFYKARESQIGSSIPNSEIDWGAYYWFEQNGGYSAYCTVAPSFAITNFRAYAGSDAGWIVTEITCNGQGNYRLLDNGVEFARRTFDLSSGSTRIEPFDFSNRVGTHQICAEVV